VNAIRKWAREHPGVSGLLIALAACLMLEAALAARLNVMRARAETQSEALASMEELAGQFRALKTRIGAGSACLAESGNFDISAVERIADESLRRRIVQSESRSERHGEDAIERTITMSFAGVRREDLVMYLAAVEAKDPAIYTRTLRLTPSKSGNDLVDAKVNLSAYEKIPTTSQ